MPRLESLHPHALYLIACAVNVNLVCSAEPFQQSDSPLNTDEVILPKGRSVPLKFTSMARAGLEDRTALYLQQVGSKNMDIYQFGVYTGNGLRKIIRSVCKSNRGCGHVWGFDSFQGIPDDSLEEKENWRDGKGRYMRSFLQGGYSAANSLNQFNLSQLMSTVSSLIGYKKNITLIPGFFNDSLNEALLHRHTLQPAMLVDMDADIYLSAIQPLDWMFAHKLIKPSTIVRYDDWPRIWATYGPARGTNLFGQAKAHYEISAKYRVRWKLVGERGSLQVLSIGDDVCDPAICGQIPDLRANVNESLLRAPLLPLWGAPDGDETMGVDLFHQIDPARCSYSGKYVKLKALPPCAWDRQSPRRPLES